jgi:hypothetical protein
MRKGTAFRRRPRFVHRTGDALRAVERFDVACTASLRQTGGQQHGRANDSCKLPGVHGNLLAKLPVIITSADRLCSFRQQFSHAKVREHHVGGPIQGFIIGSFKAFPFHRRMKQRINLMHEMGDVLVCDITGIVLEQVVHAYEQIRDRVQPGEPRILLQKLDQDIDGWNRAAEAFIGLLLGNNQGAVKCDETFSN